MSDSWHSYPSIYALGHRALGDLFDGHVVIEEKVDGSQFSFGIFDGEIKCRSKGQQLVVDAPEKMFARAVDTVREIAPLLRNGWTYRGEYLQSPKHNALTYGRTPEKHVILFDINVGHEQYLAYDDKFTEARRLGLEVVPLLGSAHSPAYNEEYMLSLLETDSILGGVRIEGFVVKNYSRFGPDKKALMGKFVSEAFKEKHATEWKMSNPAGRDVVQKIIDSYRTPARFQKAVQHLRERGEIEDSPRDIGKVMVEAKADLRRETEDEIKDLLYRHYWPQIERGATAGIAEWYKEQLLARQFQAAQ